MTTIRKRRLSLKPRRTLELLKLLASSPHGATEALFVRAHGFDSDMVASLVCSGLATAGREIMSVGAKPVEVVRLQITAAGRKVIEE
jgi:phosphomannomutase